jgi:glycosyltransferase involved in cell wall biosynthesis
MDRPRRLVFVTADLRTGGAERNVATLLPALDRSRYAASVCCLQARGAFYDDVIAAGVPAVCLDAGDSNLAAPRALAALVRHLSRERPDVVMTQGFNAGILGRIAARIARVPVVATWKHNVGHLGRHGRLERLGERLVGRWTSRYLGVSYRQLDYLTEFMRIDPARIRVVYNTLDPVRYSPISGRDPELAAELGIHADEFVIACVAVLREEKDHATLLQAMRHVVDTIPDARLLVIGDGPDRARLETLATQLAISPNVRFLGSRTDVLALLGVANVATLSSFTIENFPYAILEAMAVGRGAVCTAVGGLPEMIEDELTGYLVPPKDPRALSRRLIDVARSPDRGVAMGAAARRRLEDRFSIGTAAARVADVLDDTLEEAAAAGRPQPLPA